jgi:hypothetical protein
MKKGLVFLVFAVLLAVLPINLLLASQPMFTITRLTSVGPVAQQYWGDRLLVKFRSGYAPTAASTKSAIRAVRADNVRRLTVNFLASAALDGYYTITHRGTVAELLAFRASLASDPTFEWVSLSPVFKVSQAEMVPTVTKPYQWQIQPFVLGNIHWETLPKMWAEHIYLYVADTGACFGHEGFDWSRNFWNYNAIDSDKPAMDDHGHGCAVTSIVVARNNGKGIDGLAPFVKFGEVKVLNGEGYGAVEDIVNGILAVAQNAQ